MNNISSSDKSEVCQSKVSSDISQSIKNVPVEKPDKQKVNDEFSVWSLTNEKNAEMKMVQIILL